jgi:hypothetical protein
LREAVRPGMTTEMNRRSVWIWTRACLIGSALAAVVPSSAWAGPVEVFNSIEVASGNPDRVTARWINGDGGIFISTDRAASFEMSCYTAVTGDLMGRSVQAFKTATDGSACVGTVDKTYCSNPEGCGWKEATELSGRWISDFAEDPIDKNILYLVTGTAEGDNGVWSRESPTAMWKPLGTQLPAWFSRVFVVKNGAGRRIYVSSQENVMVEGTDGGPAMQVPKYFIRYSDDNGVTWTSHYYGEVPDRTNLRLVGVDPTNPDRIVILLVRTAEQLTDDLFYSDKRGEPGSYVKIGTVTQYSGVTFMPDGTLWYGDNDQMTPALYKVPKLGEPPVQLSTAYKVGCVNYDAASERLYVCADWRMGTADVTSGAFNMLFDIRTASKFLECKDEAPLSTQCAPALRSPNFCDVTHFPAAPVCVEYFGTGGSAAAGGAGGNNAVAGAGGMSVGGSGGESGKSAGTRTGGAGGSSGAAGSAGGGKAAPGAKGKDSGCSVRAIGANERESGWLGLGFAFVLAGYRRKRRHPARTGA